MNCPNCKARNPIGNKFCRECGQKMEAQEGTLAAEEIRRVEEERKRERAAQLIIEANALLEKGEVALAIPLAEEAAALAPQSTTAHALCVRVFERARDTEKAIAALEKVVALNPDSAADQDKLERLRRGVHLMPRPVAAPTEDSPRRWVPMLAAGIVGGLALVIGGVVLSYRNREPEVVGTPTPRATPTTAAPEATAQLTPGGIVAPAKPFLATVPPDGPVRDPFTKQGWSNMPTPSPRPQLPEATGPRFNVTESTPPSGPTLPNPNLFNRAAPREAIGGVGPVTIPAGAPRTGGDSIPAGPPQGTITAGPPQAGRESNREGNSEQPGYIRIREHPPVGDGSGNSRQGAQVQGDPLLRAQGLQTAGKYREAITAYREALAAGASSGEVQQAIALCHQRLGETGPARTAYQQAIAAYEAQLRGGRGSVSAQRGIAACRAALEVLSG